MFHIPEGPALPNQDRESPQSTRTAARNRDGGFNLFEVTVVVLITMIVFGMALPSLTSVLRSYRSFGDAKSISNEMSLARMRAAADFTRTRVYFDLNAKTYQLQTYNKSSSQFQLEGGVENLSTNDSFGFGAIATAAGTQSTIGQPSACLNSAGTVISNTSCILFNSRGIPVDSTGAVTSNDSIYLSDGSGGYAAVAASPSGRVAAYHYTGSSWHAS